MRIFPNDLMSKPWGRVLSGDPRTPGINHSLTHTDTHTLYVLTFILVFSTSCASPMFKQWEWGKKQTKQRRRGRLCVRERGEITPILEKTYQHGTGRQGIMISSPLGLNAGSEERKNWVIIAHSYKCHFPPHRLDTRHLERTNTVHKTGKCACDRTPPLQS